MNNEIFMQIIGAILTIITALITAYVIPWIRAKATDSQLEQIRRYIELAVRCAEQIYSPEEWETKKEYVMNYIINIVNQRFSVHLTVEDIDIMVEGVVNEVKKWKS